MEAVKDIKVLRHHYCEAKKSVAEIALLLECSPSKVNYWVKKFGIQKRSIGEAIYARCNPNGDPFKVVKPQTTAQRQLLGLGVGLYWGEGTRSSRHEVRLSNSDPKLIGAFMRFLKELFTVEMSDLRFQLHIHEDVSVEEALEYWTRELKIKRTQWAKPFVLKSNKPGTYKRKRKYGVVTVCFYNVKLRNIIMDLVCEQ